MVVTIHVDNRHNNDIILIAKSTSVKIRTANFTPDMIIALFSYIFTHMFTHNFFLTLDNCKDCCRKNCKFYSLY